MANGNGATVIPFPVERRIDSHARQAVANLARAHLLSEREAVRLLEDMGAPAAETDLVRAIYAVKRHMSDVGVV